MSYDSRVETYKHIQIVQKLMMQMIIDLQNRSHIHDQSKLISPEKELFDEWTPKLADSTYMSDTYKEFLVNLKPALDHHYAANSHHPEHYKNGINDMNLLDLIEMMCDWKAATMRHKNGDIFKSIEENQTRFKYSDQLKQIFLNTVKLF